MFSEKASVIARMRQKCVRKRQKCVKIASKMRQKCAEHLWGRTPFGRYRFYFNGGCTRGKQIALSLKRHLFPHGGRKPKAFWIYISTLPPILNIFSNFSSSALKRHLLKRHLTLSDSLCFGTLSGYADPARQRFVAQALPLRANHSVVMSTLLHLAPPQ